MAITKSPRMQRTFTGSHGGRGCERLRVSGDNGSYVYLSHEIGEARIIGELAASVWLNADRPGLQILLRAVLPHSIDPNTGRPLTTLLRGSGYTQAGNWQQLRIDNLPRLLERQVRVLRAEHGPQIDDREAFVDLVLLNVYGGPGTTTVSIDDLEVAGIVGRPASEVPAASAGRRRPLDSAAERLPSTTTAAPAAGAAMAATAQSQRHGTGCRRQAIFPPADRISGRAARTAQSSGIQRRAFDRLAFGRIAARGGGYEHVADRAAAFVPRTGGSVGRRTGRQAGCPIRPGAGLGPRAGAFLASIGGHQGLVAAGALGRPASTSDDLRRGLRLARLQPNGRHASDTSRPVGNDFRH